MNLTEGYEGIQQQYDTIRHIYGRGRTTFSDDDLVKQGRAEARRIWGEILPEAQTYFRTLERAAAIQYANEVADIVENLPMRCNEPGAPRLLLEIAGAAPDQRRFSAADVGTATVVLQALLRTTSCRFSA